MGTFTGLLRPAVGDSPSPAARRYVLRNGVLVDATTGVPVPQSSPEYAAARAAAAPEAQPQPQEAAEEPPRPAFAGMLRRVPGAETPAAPLAAAGQPAAKAGTFAGMLRPARPTLPWEDPDNPLRQAAARGAALPTAAMPEPERDPGLINMAAAAAVSGAGVPWAGIGETLHEHPILARLLAQGSPIGSAMADTIGQLPKGSAQALQAAAERVRDAYLTRDPGKLRAASALAAEFGGQLLPLLPAGELGEIAAQLTGKGGKLAQRIARVAAPGAVEGAAVGVGATTEEKSPLTRAARVLAYAGAGAGLSGLAGIREHARLDANGGSLVGDGSAQLPGRAGRSESGATLAGAGADGGTVRGGVHGAADRRPASVETGVGDAVPLPVGPLFRGEASAPGVAPGASGPSHLWGRHFTESRGYAELHAGKYGEQGRVVEHQVDVEKPFSVAREYSYAELRQIDPDAARRAARAAGVTGSDQPIHGAEFQKALRDSYLDRQGAHDPSAADLEAAVEHAGRTLQTAGFDSYHHEVTVPGEKPANAWALFGGQRNTGHLDAAIDDYARRNLAHIGEGANPKPEGGSQAARTAWMNRDAALEDLGGDEMRYAVQRARGAPESAKTPLLHGIYERTPDGGFARDAAGNPVRTARSAKEILTGVDRRDLNVFMAAQQDMRLARQGKAGTREAESKAALEALSQKYGLEDHADGPRVKLLAERADELRDWFVKASLDPLIEAGRITAADKARMLEAAEGSYAPMRKLHDIIAEEAEGFSQGAAGGRYQGKGNPVKRRTRSFDEEGGRNIMPVEEMARRAYQVGIWTERQRVANTLANLHEREAARAARPGAGDPHEAAVVIRRAEVQPKPIARLTVDDLREMGLPEDALDGMEDFTHILYRASKDQPPGTFAAYEAGKPVYYEAPTAVLKALEGEKPQVAGFLARLAQSQSRLVRAGAVFAPAFIGTNLLKDQLGAFLFTPGLMYKPFWSAAKGLADSMGKGEYYREAVASGSLHGTLVSGDRLKMQAFIDEALGAEGSWKRFANPVESLAALSEALENGTRVGIFMEARKRGMSIEQARDLTREATIDFSRKGELGEKVNRYAAFFNAGMQGLSKVWRSMGDDVIKAARGDEAAKKRAIDLYAKGALAVTVPSIALWLKNHNDPDYQRVEQEKKDRMWHLFKVNPSSIPGLGDHFRDEPVWVTLPKPFELGWLFGTAAERMLDFVVQRDPRAVREFLTDFVGQISPDPTPNFIKPIAENAINKSLHFDRPVVPDYMHPSEGYPNTSPTIMAAARGADAIGLDEVPLARQLASPLQLQNLARGYTGGLGGEAVRLADTVGEATGLFPDRPDMPATITETPLVGGFARGVLSPESRGSRSEQVDRFYEVSKEIQQLAGKLGRAADRRDRQGYADVADIKRDHPEYKWANYTRSVTKQLSGLNDQIRTVRNNRSLTPQQRAMAERHLELQMSALAERALAKINR